MVSTASVNINSGGYIHSEGGNFGLTPTVNLQAAGDIGAWNGESLTPWAINTGNNQQDSANLYNPGTLTLNAVSATGAVELASYAGVNINHLQAAQTVSLEVYGDYAVPTAAILIGADTSGTGAGTVASTGGNVSLITDNGNITAAAGNLVKAQGTVALLAMENLYQNTNGAPGNPVMNNTVFNLGDSTNALAISAASVALGANGNIYATLPATGVADILVGRMYVDAQNANNFSGIGSLMPAGTVQINQTGSPLTQIVAITDGGVSGSSTLAVNYGSALNFTYNAVDAIQLGTVNLGSGNLTLGISNPYQVGITSVGSSISGAQVSFNLNSETNYAAPDSVASGGFGTAGSPINTQVASISGTTTGATAGFYVNQTGALTLSHLETGGGIGVTSTGTITLEGSIGSQNADVNLNAGNASIVSANPPVITSDSPRPLISACTDLTLSGAMISLADRSIASDTGNVSLTTSSGDLTLANSSITANNGSVALTATSGALTINDSSLTSSGAVLLSTAALQPMIINNSNVTSNGDNVSILAAGTLDLTGSSVNTGSGSITLTQGVGSLDLSAATVYGNTNVDITADQDITIGALNAGQTATLTATGGVIQGTTNSVSLNAPDVVLNAASGIGTVHSVLVSGGYGNTISATTTTGDVNLLTGQQSDQYSNAILNVATGAGAIDVINNYGTLELASVVSNGNGANSLGNIFITNQTNNTSLQIDTVTAAGGGAMVALKAPAGSIYDDYVGAGITASRIAINALGQGGSIYSGGSPQTTVNDMAVSGVQVNGQAVVAVASGDIALNSTNTSLTQMPLVASNGSGSTINIVSFGDFQTGQIVAGLNAGTVNINSAGSIYDDGNANTQIQSAIVNLAAAHNIGTTPNPVATAAHDYSNNTAGVISAASVGTGDMYLSQQGAVILQTLSTGNGAVTAQVAGNTFVNLADSHATDASGNNVNITLSSGDMTVNQAIAGATQGTVNLTATAGSILGDANNSAYGSPYSPNGTPTPRDCCTDPHVSGSAANLVALNNLGYNGSDATQTLSLNSAAISTSTTVNGASTVLFVANPVDQSAGSAVTLGGNAFSFTAPGAGSIINIEACNNLDLSGMGDGTAWLHTGTGANVTLAAVNDLLLPNVLNTSTNASLGTLTLIGSNDVLAPDNGSTQHTLTIHSSNLLLKTGAAGSTGSADTTDSLIVNATGTAADVIVTGSVPTDLSVITDSHTIIGAANNNGNIAIGMPGAGTLNIYAVTDTAANGTVTLNATAGKIAQAAQDNLSQFNAPGVTANGITFHVLNDIGTAANPLTLAVNNVGANIGSDGGIYLAIAPPSGTATLTGMTTYNGDIDVTSTGALTVDSAIQAGTQGNGNVTLGAAGDIALNNSVTGTGTGTVGVTAGGNVIDGFGSANASTVVGSSINIASTGTTGGAEATTPLWVNAATITATSAGAMLITDAATTPVTLAVVNSHNGAITIESAGTINMNKIDAGSGAVTITSDSGAINDVIAGHASLANPNIRSTGTVTLNASTSVGSINDSTWVAGTLDFSGGTTPNSPDRLVWINYVPPVINPYPNLPTIAGVANQTVYAASAYGEKTAPLSLPFVVAGSIQRTSEPMKVDISGFGVTVPDGLGPFINVQDQAFNTQPAPIEGGNETEYGRKSQSAIATPASN